MKAIFLVGAVAVGFISFSAAYAQNAAPPSKSPPSKAAPAKSGKVVAARPTTSGLATDRVRRVAYEAAAAGEHPLAPTLRIAREGLKRLEAIKDYSGNLIRRERIEGKLRDYEYQYVKVRHEPFSVYTYFQSPRRGSEVIYVAGKNDGQLLAHETGAAAGLVGTVALDPDGPRARKESRLPISQTGLMNLCKRVIVMCERDSKYGECEVKVFPDAKVNDRSHLCVQVTHPAPRREFRFHIGRIYFDNELGFPTRWEAYGWPSKPGEESPLQEEYTVVDLKLDVGFTDADFDVANPAYGFPRP
jgi:hypothetical protein